ncbi:T9SS type A sorting domain-containing protein [Hymenobacter busanensis]|uniref:T9SS type A sorting domain-containing protein n=1 Tax=Hymenobacter busanensis TaxID=2607656 RepID=A0A7L5A190_9BACT|nr:M64 family metallopeptidase [Hymenobacter busanensis]KAA9332171.1 T9SS type A sorting domain-containing protein [Hymenobacter busanensis]QHJ07490.1 T9SS type A sorting domain-containing protein [Hymenobacter busanensis]
MKTLFTLCSALLLALGSLAQSFPVDTLVKTGPLNKRINLVFLSDGYQSGQLTQYRTDVDRIVNDLFNQTPFREYRPYFNVFAVRVPSVQSGASHPRTASDCGTTTLPTVTVNNYFGSAFDQFGIHRLLVPTRSSAIASVLAASFPQYDQAFVVVNSPEYGGSGGALATSSINASASEISIHEIGHSFAALADEYWAGPQYATEKANMTQQTNPTLVKWAAWMNTNGVGIYPYPGGATWYRPHQNCKMQLLGVPFCSVCRETFVERMHTLAPPLQSFSPAATTINGPTQDLSFALSLLKPVLPNTLRVVWKRDGTVVARNADALAVPLSGLSVGAHRIQAEITDTTALTRSTSHLAQHTYVVAWDVNRTAAGTTAQAAAYEYRLETYPNPVDRELTLSYTLSRPLRVEATILDATGRRLKTLVRAAEQKAGTHDYRFTADDLGLKRPGTYLLVLNLDGNRITRQLMKE